MKICVYAICKNEENNIIDWFNSISEADNVTLIDTGSTDNTIAIAESLGIDVYKITVDPWRFDTARNMAFDIVKNKYDYYFALDLDERPSDNWYSSIEAAAEQGATRISYRFIDGEFDGVLRRIHDNNYYWAYPIHEDLLHSTNEEHEVLSDMVVRHYPDVTKDESYNLDLLTLSFEEYPDNPRNVYYLAFEYYRMQDFEKAKELFLHWLSVVGDAAPYDSERVCRMLSDISDKEYWLLQALNYAPDKREPYAELCMYYYPTNLDLFKYYANIMLSIDTYPVGYYKEELAWSDIIPNLLTELEGGVAHGAFCKT